MTSAGVLYIGIGERHFAEACRSARSLRQHMPDVTIALFTDQTDVPNLFDQVLPATASALPFRDKIIYLSQSPFEHTVFIDTDTLICAPLDDLFTLLDQFDIAVAFDYKHMNLTMHGVPQSFPEPNSGVLTYRNSDKMRAFFDAWLHTFDALCAKSPYEIVGDQTALRKTLYESDVRLMILPQQYHARYLDLGILVGPAHIVHGRPVDQFYEIEQVAAAFNHTTAPRVFVGGQIYEHRRSSTFIGGRRAVYIARYSWRMWRTSWLHLRAKLRERGWLATLAFIGQRFKRLSDEQRAYRNNSNAHKS